MFHKWPPQSAEEKRADANLESRKASKEVRRERFLDSKLRSIGLDLETLDEQVRMKAEQDAALHAEEKAADASSLQMLEHLQVLADEDVAARRAARDGVQGVWRTQDRQRALRPEWDLSDPSQLRRDSVPSKDASGPSSAQFLSCDVGDESARATLAAKQRAQHDLISAKVAENGRMRALEAEHEALHAEISRQQVVMRTRKEEEASQERSRLARSFDAENAALARLKEDRARVQAEFAALEHQYILDARLHEESRAKTVNGEGKVVRQEWKGLTPEQLAECEREQRAQAEQNKQPRLEAAQRKRQDDDDWEQSRLARVEKERVAAQGRSDKNAATRDFCHGQHGEAQARRTEESDYRLAKQREWWPFGASDR